MPAPEVNIERVESLRRRRYRVSRGVRVHSEAEALDFINAAGFVWLLPARDAELPNLHDAYVAGRSDTSWWDWKQTLPEKKSCYYAKAMRGRGTFISWPFLPAFYAVYGPRRPIEQGLRHRPSAQQRILALLGERGSLDSRELRQTLAGGPKGRREMVQALQALQTDFLVAPCGGELEGWSLHRWALTERWVSPRLLREARKLDPDRAASDLVRRFVGNCVLATVADIAWVFNWSRSRSRAVVDALIRAGDLVVVSAADLGEDLLLNAPDLAAVAVS